MLSLLLSLAPRLLLDIARLRMGSCLCSSSARKCVLGERAGGLLPALPEGRCAPWLPLSQQQVAKVGLVSGLSRWSAGLRNDVQGKRLLLNRNSRLPGHPHLAEKWMFPFFYDMLGFSVTT